MANNGEDQRILEILDSLGTINSRKKEVEELRGLFMDKLKRQSLFKDNSIVLYDTYKNPQFKQDLAKCLHILQSMLNFTNLLASDRTNLYSMKSDLLHVIELNEAGGEDIIPHALELARVVRDMEELENFSKDTLALSTVFTRHRTVFTEIRQVLDKMGVAK